MSVKVEFENRSGETLKDAVVTVGDAGGDGAVLPGGKGPASCSVDDYFKVSVDRGKIDTVMSAFL